MLNGVSSKRKIKPMTKRAALNKKKCVSCSSDLALMKSGEISKRIKTVDNWSLIDDKKIKKIFVFGSFKEAIGFINSVAEISEEEGHHPDICNYYKSVEITLWTHKINGLHENDFVIAQRIDQIKNK